MAMNMRDEYELEQEWRLRAVAENRATLSWLLQIV